MRIINLLPKLRQEELRYETVLQSLYLVVWFSIVSFALVFLAQLVTKVYLDAEYRDVTSEIELVKGQIKKKENAKVQNDIKVINDLVSDYKNLTDKAPKWSKVLKAFAVLPPPGVKINSFSVNLTGKMVSISGVADTREEVLQLHNILAADTAEFSNVDNPLDNLAKATNSAFHFTFTVNDSLLK